jgi:hypothetical protein
MDGQTGRHLAPGIIPFDLEISISDPSKAQTGIMPWRRLVSAVSAEAT